MSVNILLPSVCVDFDHTLLLYDCVESAWGGLLNTGYEYFNGKLIKELLQYKDLGHSVHIVTFRGPNTSVFGSEEYKIDKYLKQIENKWGLVFDSVVYTDHQPKTPFLLKLNASRFYDDHDGVICDVIINGKNKIRPIFMKYGEIRNPILQEFIDRGLVDIMEIE